MSSAQSSFLIWPPVLHAVRCVRQGKRERDVPVNALDLDRLAVLDGSGEGDYIRRGQRAGHGGIRTGETHCLDAIGSGRRSVLARHHRSNAARNPVAYMELGLLRGRLVKVDFADGADLGLAHLQLVVRCSEDRTWFRTDRQTDNANNTSVEWFVPLPLVSRLASYLGTQQAGWEAARLISTRSTRRTRSSQARTSSLSIP